jgi:hypothetical protein
MAGIKYYFGKKLKGQYCLIGSYELIKRDIERERKKKRKIYSIDENKETKDVILFHNNNNSKMRSFFQKGKKCNRADF